MFGAEARECEIAHRLAVRERLPQPNRGIGPPDRGAYDRSRFLRGVVHVFKLGHGVGRVTGIACLQVREQ